MRSRRDSFGRQSFVPVVTIRAQQAGFKPSCSWCGQSPAPRRPLYDIMVEPDGGRRHGLEGHFDSWACAEAYHGTTFPR